MLCLLLVGSMLFATAPAPKDNKVKQQDLAKTTTTLSQDIEVPSTGQAPQYKVDTIE